MNFIFRGEVILYQSRIISEYYFPFTQYELLFVLHKKKKSKSLLKNLKEMQLIAKV